jgi:SAM-dependent methyltransferase
MKKIKKGIYFILSYFGFYPKQLAGNFSQIFSYISDYKEIKKEINAGYKNWKFKFYPILLDKNDQSGKARGQYFYQDLYVANLIFKNNPTRHIDVGSRIDGFVAHVASFRKIDVFDIRPLKNNIINVDFLQADFMKPLENFYECTDSLSCLHTIEHFGLGRYSDPIDINGHLKGLENLYNVLKKDGLFYFSTQIGPDTIAFNAHRIFSLKYLLELFENKYEIIDFSYINDKDEFYSNVSLKPEEINNNFGCKMGCGIFTLKKL